MAEVGCPGDWAPDCTATELTREGDGTAYSREIDVPAGTYELKVTIKRSWDESADNSAKWPFIKPLLANPMLKPAAADVQSATAQAQMLLKLRFSSPLFRLGSADAINAKLTPCRAASTRMRA